MSWLKYPEKLFSSNEKTKSTIKKGIHLTTNKSFIVKKENTADTNKDENCTNSIIYGETSKQLNANTNVSENANNKPTEIYVSVSGVSDSNQTEEVHPTDHDTIKRKPDKKENADTNNSGIINGTVLSVKDPTNQMESKENTSSGIKARNVNAPTFSIRKKEKTVKKHAKRKNGCPLSVEDLNNILQKYKTKNASSETKPKEANFPTDNNAILKIDKTGKEENGKNNTQTTSTTVSCVKDPPNPLELKEITLSGCIPKELNLSTDNSTTLKKEKPDKKENGEKNNSESIVNGNVLSVKDPTNKLESKENTSSDTKAKEVNLPDNNAILKIEKTGKKENGKNNTQTTSTTVSFVKDPTNPLASKENTSSGNKPKEVNVPTDNSTTLKKENPEKKENVEKNNSQTINPLKMTKKTEELDLSWVKNPKKLLQTEEVASCSNIKTKSNDNNKKTSLPKNTSHGAAKNNLLPLDIVEQVIKNVKSNMEFKSLLEIALIIMSNENMENRKTKIDLLELYLENYKLADPNYMKQVKTTLTYCESQMSIASYFVDENDFEIDVESELGYMFGESRIWKGVISKNNIKREAVIKFNKSHDEYIRNEAVVLAKLKHPNVIELLGYDPNNKAIFLEYMNSSDLSGGLDNEIVNLDINNVRKILIDLSIGMEYIHSQKIIHRDLQLKHCLYNDKNEYKIAGFGKAVYVGDSNQEYKPVFFLPRRFFDPPEWPVKSYKTDVWTMGCCFNTILNKRRETYRLCRDNITERLQLFVANFMLDPQPGSRLNFTGIKECLQNMEI
ncbi:uncharacterized protein [Diabrotica undecimpunctata]|uniref:uncharacterized protein n=1 Tax=Diabrotica undecimpunctata TaxID=50387 RepID=UPI003B63DD5A